MVLHDPASEGTDHSDKENECEEQRDESEGQQDASVGQARITAAEVQKEIDSLAKYMQEVSRSMAPPPRRDNVWIRGVGRVAEPANSTVRHPPISWTREMEEEGGDDVPDDNRSIFVGNVDLGALPEQILEIFQPCGTVNRVTVIADQEGRPRGYAFVEFLEADAVLAACMLEGTPLNGKWITVRPKRTNVPGLSRAQRPNSRGAGGRGSGGRGSGGRGYGGYASRGGWGRGHVGYGRYGAAEGYSTDYYHPYTGGRHAHRGRGRGRRGHYGYHPYYQGYGY